MDYHCGCYKDFIKNAELVAVGCKVRMNEGQIDRVLLPLSDVKIEILSSHLYWKMITLKLLKKKYTNFKI